MKLNDIVTENEYIPQDRSTAGQMGRQFLRAANGDVDAAKKMADGFITQVLAAIDSETRPMPARKRDSRVDAYA